MSDILFTRAFAIPVVLLTAMLDNDAFIPIKKRGRRNQDSAALEARAGDRMRSHMTTSMVGMSDANDDDAERHRALLDAAWTSLDHGVPRCQARA
jgi:hypothetical protein